MDIKEGPSCRLMAAMKAQTTHQGHRLPHLHHVAGTQNVVVVVHSVADEVVPVLAVAEPFVPACIGAEVVVAGMDPLALQVAKREREKRKDKRRKQDGGV